MKSEDLRLDVHRVSLRLLSQRALGLEQQQQVPIWRMAAAGDWRALVAKPPRDLGTASGPTATVSAASADQPTEKKMCNRNMGPK